MLLIAGLATFAAILVHIYLASRHYALKFGEVNTQSLCNINSTFNCEAVSASRYSEFLGVPMAVWGALTNAALLVLLLFYPLTEEAKKAAARRGLLILGGAIAGASVIMGLISTFALSAYCPFCIVTYVLSFITFGCLWAGFPRTTKSKHEAVLSGARLKFSDFTPLIIAGVVVFVAGMISNDQVRKAYGFQNIDAFVREQVQEWESNPQVQLQPVDALVMGAPADKAKMVITEFADFRCIHCKHAAPVLKAFISSHPDARLQFEVWPLDGECNTAIQSANGASCLLARASYCAEKIKGRGWDAHAYIYDNQEDFMSLDAVKSALPKIATASGLSAQEMETCAQAPETKTAIEKQAAVGTALNLRGTPTIFVNGKQLPAGQSIPVLSEVYSRLSK